MVPPSPPNRPPTRPSAVPTYLSRLSRLLTLLLALGSSAALVSTYLILPLLQSTFAARTALIKAQSERMEVLLSGLKGMRRLGIYGSTASAQKTRTDTDDGKETMRDEARESESDIIKPNEKGTVSSDRPDQIKVTENLNDSEESPVSPTPDMQPLITSLRLLSQTRRNTSTTRTSLLSTIEAWTSALHRQLWNPAPGHSIYNMNRHQGVGLGSLDHQLALAGGKKGQKQNSGANVWSDGTIQIEDVSDRREEWDAVRREVRGIKGLLLGRRTFAQPT